ncbi:MaoC family dehydratase [Kineococcus rhizosphaerae]|uniref:Acyl dehydratase n=1 Tax=Kineococcus rhizosphaerae TaxID=559628 RepID=A0A2T0R0E5_9ACTN|nr:MaoC/PaaZ C-terminal domain-containing protein [Kineococcus rhizosphaerae]PRY12601.1 acyl dehydratase [Kineococcus rhizosphaerae]
MERILTSAPSLGALYARALVSRPSRSLDFPRVRVVQRGVRFDLDQLARFCRLTGFPVRDTVPLPFPQVVGFPHQIDLMVREAFPFTVAGVLHLGQEIAQSRALGVGEEFDLAVRAVGMHAHRRGATVDLLTELSAAGEVVWTGRSRYLARGVRWPGKPVEAPKLPAPEGEGTLWRVPADTGRRYAAVSGDRNPVHLSPVTARAFGFGRAIAHGMWTASRALADLAGPAPDSARYEVQFGAPLFLSSSVRHVARRTEDGWAGAVRSRDGQRVHLAARLTVP